MSKILGVKMVVLEDLTSGTHSALDSPYEQDSLLGSCHNANTNNSGNGDDNNLL